MGLPIFLSFSAVAADRASEALTQTWNEVSSKLYQQAGAQPGGPGPEGGPAGPEQGAPGGQP